MPPPFRHSLTPPLSLSYLPRRSHNSTLVISPYFIVRHSRPPPRHSGESQNPGRYAPTPGERRAVRGAFSLPPLPNPPPQGGRGLGISTRGDFCRGRPIITHTLACRSLLSPLVSAAGSEVSAWELHIRRAHSVVIPATPGSGPGQAGAGVGNPGDGDLLAQSLSDLNGGMEKLLSESFCLPLLELPLLGAWEKASG